MVLFSHLYTVNLIMNLISKIYHKYEINKHHIIIFSKHLVIIPYYLVPGQEGVDVHLKISTNNILSLL